jgi:dUTP pyrophosphatase
MLDQNDAANRTPSQINIPIVLAENAQTPQYATKSAAGADLFASLKTSVVIPPHERILIPTGVKIALPEGFEAQIRPRSGLAFKHGITCLNATGTIDSDYRGEIRVLLINLSDIPYTIENGERIAQLIIAPVVRGCFCMKSVLESTERGSGGFGSTGT